MLNPATMGKLFPTFSHRGNFLSDVRCLRSVRFEAPRVDKPPMLMNEGGSEIYTMEFLSVLTIVHVA